MAVPLEQETMFSVQRRLEALILKKERTSEEIIKKMDKSHRIDLKVLFNAYKELSKEARSLQTHLIQTEKDGELDSFISNLSKTKKTEKVFDACLFIAVFSIGLLAGAFIF